MDKDWRVGIKYVININIADKIKNNMICSLVFLEHYIFEYIHKGRINDLIKDCFVRE